MQWCVKDTATLALCYVCLHNSLTKTDLFQKSTSARPARGENVSMHWHSYYHHQPPPTPHPPSLFVAGGLRVTKCHA